VVEITHREGLAGSPRTFADYRVKANRERLPAGVELLMDGKPTGDAP
jgi:hypothetical protein